MPRKTIPEHPVANDLRFCLGEFLKSELNQRGWTHAEFAKKIKKYGVRSSAASVKNKIARGTFSAAFLVMAAKELGYECLPLSKIELAGGTEKGINYKMRRVKRGTFDLKYPLSLYDKAPKAELPLSPSKRGAMRK